MKKSKMLLGMSLLYAFLCLSLNSCKKESTPKLTDVQQIQLAKDWYTKSQSNLAITINTSNGKTAKLVFDPNWKEAKIDVVDAIQVVTLPVTTNLKNLGDTPVNYSLVIEINDHGYISKIVSIRNFKGDTTNTLTSKQLYSTAFEKENSVSDLSELDVEVKVYGQNFSSESQVMYTGNQKINIQKNQLLQTLDTKGLEGLKVPERTMTVTCVDYYLVVKEYGYDGTLIGETREFMYRSGCSGSPDGDNTQITWIAPPEGQGGVPEEEEEETITWGNPDNVDLGITVESATATDRRFIVKWKPYSAAGGIYFESYEKINLQKDLLGNWAVKSLNHLSMSAVGSTINQTTEPILNYAEDLSSSTWATVLLSFKDKRTIYKSGKITVRISEEKKSNRSWGVGDLTL